MAQKYLDINGLERYHDGLIEYMAEAVGTQADMSVQDPTNMAYIHNVPEWVRSETKPEYNATEVNADIAGTAQTEVSNHNISNTAHEDIRNLIQEINTQKETSAWDDKYTQKEVDEKDASTLASAKAYTDTSSASALNSAKEYNDAAYANANAYTDQKIADLINGAPTTLDTLKEIADAMATEQSAVDALESAIGTKANKADLAAVATSGKYSDLSGLPTIPTNNNQLANGAGYITGINKSMVTTALGYTPPTTDTNTTYSAGTGLGLSGTTFSVSYGTVAGTACQGNDSRLSNARPASDVYSWAKASSKPSYTKAEVGLGNVDNTADSAKSVKYATSAGSASSATTASSCTGNAATATTASNLTYFKNTSTSAVGLDDTSANAICYTSGTSSILSQSDGALYKQVYNSAWVHEIYGDYRTGQIALRGKNNGTWQSWRVVLDSSNFTSYVTPAKIGAAASSHNQAASTITAGTFGGQVVAPASTAYTTNHVRNGVFTTTDPGAGASSSHANGSVIYVYE